MSDMSKKKNHEVSIRSSAAEYLTFVAANGQGGVEAVYADEDVWLSQKMMAALYDVNVRTINEHLKKIFADYELQQDSVIRKFRITASDGKTYDTQHYNLSGIIAVGYKVNSERAVQFRKWATGIIKEFTIKAYVMDDERLKNDGTIFRYEEKVPIVNIILHIIYNTRCPVVRKFARFSQTAGDRFPHIIKILRKLPQHLPLDFRTFRAFRAFRGSLFKAEQLVAVVVVLFFPVGQLGGQLGEGVQNADDFFLDG